MQTSVVTDEREFAALGPEWDAVLSASVADGPFLRHGWLLEWWRAFGCGELAILTCRDDATGALLGVLPAYRCRTGLVPLRVVRLIGSGSGGSTGLQAFALPTAEKAVFDAFVDVLFDAPTWDSLDLRPLPENSLFAELVAERVGSSPTVGTARRVNSECARPVIDLPPTWDEYLATSLNHDARRNVRRCVRRGDALGARVETVSDAEGLPAALDEAIALHEERMRHVVSPGYALSAARRSFVHASCAGLLAENRLRLLFLVIDGQRVSCECQMRYGDTRYAMWTGASAAWAHEEVSKTLFSHAVRDAIGEGCTSLDYGLGEQRYKLAWGVTRIARFDSLYAYASTSRGGMARGRDSSVAFARRALDGAPRSIRKPLWSLAQGARRLVNPR